MKLVIAKCPACGATIEISNNTTSVRCEYCNSPIVVNNTDSIKQVSTQIEKERKNQIERTDRQGFNEIFQKHFENIVQKIKEKQIGKKIHNIVSYMIMIVCMLLAIGSFYESGTLAGIIFVILAILCIPNVKQWFIKKNEKWKKIILIIKIALFIFACISLTYRTPTRFDNTWISSNGIIVTLQNSQARIQLEDGTIIDGTYTYSMEKKNNQSDEIIYKIKVRTTEYDERKEWQFQYEINEQIAKFYFINNQGEKIYFSTKELP